jgi:hypothetical protein
VPPRHIVLRCEPNQFRHHGQRAVCSVHPATAGSRRSSDSDSDRPHHHLDATSRVSGDSGREQHSWTFSSSTTGIAAAAQVALVPVLLPVVLYLVYYPGVGVVEYTLQLVPVPVIELLLYQY